MPCILKEYKISTTNNNNLYHKFKTVNDGISTTNRLVSF